MLCTTLPLLGSVFTTPCSLDRTIVYVRPYIEYTRSPVQACMQCITMPTLPSTFNVYRTFGSCTHWGHGYRGATKSSKPYVHNDCPGSAGLGNAACSCYIKLQNPVLCPQRESMWSLCVWYKHFFTVAIALHLCCWRFSVSQLHTCVALMGSGLTWRKSQRY